jgi:hypothetical protein
MIPILRIFDETKAREFYVDYLGFVVGGEHRFEAGLPLYMQVSREGCVLHLTEHHGDCCPGAAVRIETQDVDACHAERIRISRASARSHHDNPRDVIEARSWGSSGW